MLPTPSGARAGKANKGLQKQVLPNITLTVIFEHLNLRAEVWEQRKPANVYVFKLARAYKPQLVLKKPSPLKTKKFQTPT